MNNENVLSPAMRQVQRLLRMSRETLERAEPSTPATKPSVEERLRELEARIAALERTER